MTSRPAGRESGYVLVYMALIITVLLLISGLALDAGRSYVVKAQLSKAVDGAALAAARTAGAAASQAEAVRVFRANFPAGTLGTLASPDPTAAAAFYTATVDGSGKKVVNVRATVALPTTFMRLANFNIVNIRSEAEATRRLVDVSLVLDVSSSIGAKWPTVRDAVRSFIDWFDERNDRVSLVTFSNGARVVDQMSSSHGFDKSRLMTDVPQNLPGGSTLMVEGLYRGWDELRTVPSGDQGGLRVIVLFTDGASNGVPGNWTGSGVSTSIRTFDFPKAGNLDPDSQLHDDPHITGPYDTQSGANASATMIDQPSIWNLGAPGRPVTCVSTNGSNSSIPCVTQYPVMPAASLHSYHRSSGIPTSFPLSSNALTVNGAPQSARRVIYKNPANNKYQATVWNINNAARNLLEIIANEIRNDAGDQRIRIYTIGMGYLLRDQLGTMPEMPEDILKRVSNDKSSPDFNPAQLAGRYFYAPTAGDVEPAFQSIRSEILRLSK
jgi:Flp pilus assembly protein TadG